tara:strand:+ start:7134 stop:7862 length:729 start_codon:yes stop_codon:yes gene_type:complete
MMVTHNVASRWNTSKLKEKVIDNSMVPFVLKSEVHIDDFFPIPVGSVQLDHALIKKIKDFIEKNEMTFTKNVSGNGISTDFYILNRKELSDVKKALTDSVNEYFKKVINNGIDTKLHISNSWLTASQNGESHHVHTHPNSIISCVLYLNVDEEEDSILFSNPNSGNMFGNMRFSPYGSKWMQRAWKVQPNNNTLIMFPSTLEHEVPTRAETCKGERMSMSFNTWIKDATIGSIIDNADQLHL